MAPQRNNDRHPSHNGGIPKSKVRNNCNVPQEAVTPTRRDMTSNLVSTSLDWVPVSEYNSRSNYNHQSRKPTNNTSDHELTDLDNSGTFESGFGRFVPVRPQPRALPLNVQNREALAADHNDDGAGSSASGYSQHGYPHSMQNGLTPHSNHAAAAVMIVNPTTPNAVTGNMTQPFNAPGNQNRNNLTRNINTARNNFDGNSNSSNNATPPLSSSRSTKTVNLINNMYDPGQGSSSNLNENLSGRSLGEALVASCPDAAAVERRLGQIREYIRVTSSLVDTMRNSEDEAFIKHTKEEYDELVGMVMKLKESETKLVQILADKEPDNIEVPAQETDLVIVSERHAGDVIDSGKPTTSVPSAERKTDIKEESQAKQTSADAQALKKVTNLENEQLNKTLHQNKTNEDNSHPTESNKTASELNMKNEKSIEHIIKVEVEKEDSNSGVEIKEIESYPMSDNESKESDQHPKDALRHNILSCLEKVNIIEELKNKPKDSDSDIQEVVVRPMSVQSNGSTYSENELWQNEIKNKMEMSQQRLVALKQQQKRLLKYQAEAKQQLDEMSRLRDSQEIHPSTSHDNFTNMQNQLVNGSVPSRAFPPPTQHEPPHHPYSRHQHAQVVEESTSAGRDSDVEDVEMLLGERGRHLTIKLRELQLKKQHMENMVTEFQKLKMVTRIDSSHNNYSSSGEESMDEAPTRKSNKPNGNIKNEDPFKLMEIKAIKAALQKTKDLMRSVEHFESDYLPNGQDEPFQGPSHSNIHDNKSEGGGSAGGWSTEGARARPHHHCNNDHHSAPNSHEANIASLQELAQELRMETEKIMGERARIKDIVSNKEGPSRQHKKMNEEVRGGGGGGKGPAERRQDQLRALLHDKQMELEALLRKERVLVDSEGQVIKQESRAASIVNQSYNSEQEEPDSRTEQIMAEAQSSRDSENYRVGDSSHVGRSHNAVTSHVGSAYASDSDSASRTKSNQRNRCRRRQTIDRQPEEDIISPPSHQNIRPEPRADSTNVNAVPPMSQSGESSSSLPYPHMPPPPCWTNNKSNQDMRANQFTQNSHSQTMDRLLGTPQMSYPPSMPFNMMMPYGVGCGCGCGAWAAWCWQQLAATQRDLMQLREQMHHLEERWRVETASHTLNNQVPPGNRANNYWDNFRSYSRQNLLSGSSKTNAPGPCAAGAGPLAERSHNALHPAPPARSHNALHPPPPADKRNDTRRPDERPDPAPHDNNLNASANSKKKSCSKLPAKNSSARRNYSLDYSPTSSVNIASASDAPNPNLASASREPHDKTPARLPGFLRENVYSEVSTLIGANESHPDYLIQLFRELQQISSDPLRQRVLQSIRSVLSPPPAANPPPADERAPDQQVSTTSDAGPARNYDPNAAGDQGASSSQMDNGVVRFLLVKSEDICTPELLDMLATVILNSSNQPQMSKKRLLETLAKYEGMRVCEASGDILESLRAPGADMAPDSDAMLQDVAGALTLFSTSEPQLHQLDACPYELWADGGPRADKVDLITCADMTNGDLAEADQSRPDPPADRPDRPERPDALPDVVDTDEVTPTEAEAEWLGLDRVPTRLHMGESPEKQKD